MATSLKASSSHCSARSASQSSHRLPVVRPTALPLGGGASSSSSSSSSLPRNVQVFGKGKGRRMQAPMAPSGEMVKPQVPPVDADGNEQFCVFVRATSGSYQNWIFVSVVTGGAAAKGLVRGLQNEWGKKLYTRGLITSIGASIYKDRDAIVGGIKKQVRSMLQYSNMAPQARLMEPILNQPTQAFEFAFKIRDQSKPGDFQKPDGLTLVPSEAELSVLPLQQFQQFFSPDNLAGMFKGSS